MKRTIKAFLVICCLAIAFTLCLTACGNKCEHTYDNACDATCNECEETREVGAHDWSAATCTAPKTCKICGATDSNALGHAPADDDGDCTTEVKCTVCGDVTTPAGQHTPNNDDGDCTTPITCSVCGTTTTPAKDNHTGGTATCLGYKCAVCGAWYGDTDANKHASDEFTYTANADGTTHTKKHKCCGAVADVADAHTFNANSCICGAIQITDVNAPNDDDHPFGDGWIDEEPLI